MSPITEGMGSSLTQPIPKILHQKTSKNNFKKIEIAAVSSPANPHIKNTIPKGVTPDRSGQDIYIRNHGLQTKRHGAAVAKGIILHINAHNEVRSNAAAMVPAIYGDLNREGWDVQALYLTLPLAQIVANPPFNFALQEVAALPEVEGSRDPQINLDRRIFNRRISVEISRDAGIDSTDVFARILARMLWDYRRQGYEHIVLSGQRIPAFHLLHASLVYPDLPYDHLIINDPTPDWTGQLDNSYGNWLIGAMQNFPTNRAVLLSFSENSSFFPGSDYFDELEEVMKRTGLTSYVIRGDEQRVRRKLTSWSFSPQVFSHFYKHCLAGFLDRSYGERSRESSSGFYDCAPNDDRKANADWMQLRSDIIESSAEMLTPTTFQQMLVGRPLAIKTILGIRAQSEYTSDGRHIFHAQGKSYETTWFFEGYNICTKRGEGQTCRRIYRYADNNFIFLNPANGKVTSWSRYQEDASEEME
ncbi:MAG: hypothetical protein V7776_12325 [Halopseudomonas aestusnigri]